MIILNARITAIDKVNASTERRIRRICKTMNVRFKISRSRPFKKIEMKFYQDLVHSDRVTYLVEKISAFNVFLFVEILNNELYEIYDSADSITIDISINIDDLPF